MRQGDHGGKHRQARDQTYHIREQSQSDATGQGATRDDTSGGHAERCPAGYGRRRRRPGWTVTKYSQLEDSRRQVWGQPDAPPEQTEVYDHVGGPAIATGVDERREATASAE